VATMVDHGRMKLQRMARVRSTWCGRERRLVGGLPSRRPESPTGVRGPQSTCSHAENLSSSADATLALLARVARFRFFCKLISSHRSRQSLTDDLIWDGDKFRGGRSWCAVNSQPGRRRRERIEFSRALIAGFCVRKRKPHWLTPRTPASGAVNRHLRKVRGLHIHDHDAMR
jgi:hypothetical protein